MGGEFEALVLAEVSTRRLLGPLGAWSCTGLLFLMVRRWAEDVALELPRALFCEVIRDEDELSGFHSRIQEESLRLIGDGKRSAEEDLRYFAGFGDRSWRFSLWGFGGWARCLPALTD